MLGNQWIRYNIAIGLLTICTIVFQLPILFDSSPRQKYHMLIGTWIRTDGGNTLVIEHVDRDGKVLASYIRGEDIVETQSHVSTASGDMELSVDLRRLGKSGRTYKLRYDKESDQLVGVYHHHVFRQDYQIYFVRQ